MGARLVKTYTVYCDGIKEDGEECCECEGSQLDPEPAIEDAVAGGWLRVGKRKTYCPTCRPKYEPKKKT